MESENRIEIKKLPQITEGWLGDYWGYNGKKFETEESALEFRSKTLADYGIKDTHPPESKKKSDPKTVQEETNERVYRASDHPPGITLLLNFLGFVFIIAGFVSLVNYWPEGGAEMDILKILVLGNGMGLIVFGIFSLGFAKIISLLSRIEKNTHK